jgi:hypothetical protein
MDDWTYFPGVYFAIFSRFYVCSLQVQKQSIIFNSSQAFALEGSGVKKVHPQGRRIVFVRYYIVHLSQR